MSSSHTLFQVSTSNALLEGVFQGTVTVRDLINRGDFGLGTFSGLDGELIMLDRVAYQASAGGAVREVDGDSTVPFAVVTEFEADVAEPERRYSTFQDFTDRVDGIRPSENMYAAIAARGRFGELMLRAACPAIEGEGLVAATAHQSEFAASDIAGDMVGFWSPMYASAVSVPGYHFHFISSDRTLAGHVLAVENADVAIELQIETEFQVAFPETEEFLNAHLDGDRASEISEAESQ